MTDEQVSAIMALVDNYARTIGAYPLTTAAARAAVEAALKGVVAPPGPEPTQRDAKRYQLLRRGQHWSVVNGIGDYLRADDLDAAIDKVIAANASTEATTPQPASEPVARSVTVGEAMGASKLLMRAVELHEKAGMPWVDAEELALREAGIDDRAIDELIGNCAYSGLSSILADEDELRQFTRAVLVHSPLYATPQPAAKQAEPVARDDPSVPDVDWLANVIRLIDGGHALGTGSMAEKIVLAMQARAQRLAASPTQPAPQVFTPGGGFPGDHNGTAQEPEPVGERKSFEAWYGQNFPEHNHREVFSRNTAGYGEYWFSHVQSMWEAYEAGRASLPPAPTPK